MLSVEGNHKVYSISGQIVTESHDFTLVGLCKSQLLNLKQSLKVSGLHGAGPRLQAQSHDYSRLGVWNNKDLYAQLHTAQRQQCKSLLIEKYKNRLT